MCVRDTIVVRMSGMSDEQTGHPSRSPARVPPRWFVRAAWAVHRGLHRVSGGRFLREEKQDAWGMMSVTTMGRRSGRERTVILAYHTDGADIVIGNAEFIQPAHLFSGRAIDGRIA